MITDAVKSFILGDQVHLSSGVESKRVVVAGLLDLVVQLRTCRKKRTGSRVPSWLGGRLRAAILPDCFADRGEKVKGGMMIRQDEIGKKKKGGDISQGQGWGRRGSTEVGCGVRSSRSERGREGDDLLRRCRSSRARSVSARELDSMICRSAHRSGGSRRSSQSRPWSLSSHTGHTEDGERGSRSAGSPQSEGSSWDSHTDLPSSWRPQNPGASRQSPGRCSCGTNRERGRSEAARRAEWSLGSATH